MKLRMTITINDQDRAILEQWERVFKVKFSNSISRCIQKEWKRQQSGSNQSNKPHDGVDEVSSDGPVIE